MAETLAELMPKINNVFEFLSVHREMIQDKVRTNAYKEAIFKKVKSGDVVLDVGTGTGLLSFFCVQAGASKVYAIEKADIIEVAKENAKINGFEDKVVFINDDSRNVILPEKVDIIVSEVIGHFALEENMLDSIIDAKKRFLRKGGILIPSSVDLYFAPIEARQIYEDEINYWCRNADGIDFSASKVFAVNNVYIKDVSKSTFLSTYKKVKTLNLYKSKINIRLNDSFFINKKGVFHGLAGWFVATLCDNIFINTSPSSISTHWRQCFFPIEEPIEVSPGDIISVNFYSKSLGEDVIWQWEFKVKSDCYNYSIKLSTSNLLTDTVLKDFWLNSRKTNRVNKAHEFLLNVK